MPNPDEQQYAAQLRQSQFNARQQQLAQQKQQAQKQIKKKIKKTIWKKIPIGVKLWLLMWIAIGIGAILFSAFMTILIIYVQENPGELLGQVWDYTIGWFTDSTPPKK